MTLNELRDWHARQRDMPSTTRASYLWHREAVTCLDYAIRDWDRNAEREERLDALRGQVVAKTETIGRLTRQELSDHLDREVRDGHIRPLTPKEREDYLDRTAVKP
jgi:hypothetical protein